MGQARLGRGARVFGIGIAAVAMASGAYAYTAGNTMPTESRAGSGDTEITGFEVTDVQYDLDSTDPSTFDLVRFTLVEDARSVRAKVESGSSAYSTCTETTAQVWECDLTGIAVVDADELTVIATD